MSALAQTHPSVPGPLSTFPIFSLLQCLTPLHLFHIPTFPLLYPTLLPPRSMCLPVVLEVQTEFLWAKSACLHWAVCQSGPSNL